MQKVQNRVYFDSSSTTDVSAEVLDTYTGLLHKYYVNSESLYREGAEINRMMEKARGAIAALFAVSPNEVIFTSGSSESNTSAIKGVCFGCPGRKHIITTNVEHSSIMNACRQMEEVFGYEVTYLPVDGTGKIWVREEGGKIIRYRCYSADGAHWWQLDYVTNANGTVTTIDMKYDP